MKEELWFNNNHEHYKHPKHHKDEGAKLFETLQDSPEFQHDIKCLSEIYTHLFGTQHLGNYCVYTNEPQQCSDGSDLYTLIKYQGKDLIIKVGAGEFNTKVFTTGNVKELKGFYNSPLPLFVVNQYHSCKYLPNEKDYKLSITKPRVYLDQYSVIVYPRHKEAYYRTEKDRHKKPIDYNHIHIMHYDDAVMVGRKALLEKAFPNGEFENAVYMLKRLKMMSFDDFYKQIRKGRDYLSKDMYTLLECLRNMGITTVGSVVGHKEAFLSLYELIQMFDVQKKTFISSFKKDKRG